ncbi:MAG TPA: GGDEF domain-containing protein [Gemmatimonadaceae bacterium]|jgi:diguanylate cyclase (GGDEF)-like protein|nr:GGDEF domain-containing protein [Gemmatimonadaceae bacterium]
MRFVIEFSIGIIAVLALTLALLLAIELVLQRRAAHTLKKLASTEPLTGLANRREFTRLLESEVSRSLRSGRSFSVLLVDVDRLKPINDRCGHRAGDIAIRRVANALRVSCRVSDTAARVGGDEFAVILPESTDLVAGQFLARVRDVLAHHRRGGEISISGGVAQFPRDAHTAESLLDAVDAALYADKQSRPRITPAWVPAQSRPSTHLRSQWQTEGIR